MKLHLGCGMRYLDGYVNIDYPSSEHSVQTKAIADKFCDIKALKYANKEIEEVRLHHVFEHFDRPQACALLTTWAFWLKDGGVLRVEVPDFTKTALSILNPFSSFRKKMIGIRHLFGSHEAKWAYHYEGYTQESLKKMLEANDFKVAEVKRNSWKGTFNIEIIAKKINSNRTANEFFKSNKEYLSQFLVDDSESNLLDIWMNSYSEQTKNSLER